MQPRRRRNSGKIIVSDTGELGFDVLEDALRDGLKTMRIDVLILGHAHDVQAKNFAELLRKWDGVWCKRLRKLVRQYARHLVGERIAGKPSFSAGHRERVDSRGKRSEGRWVPPAIDAG